jgi:hypothetical protein
VARGFPAEAEETAAAAKLAVVATDCVGAATTGAAVVMGTALGKAIPESALLPE